MGNPFKTPKRRRQYEQILDAYTQKSRPLFYPSGDRCLGNSMATAFWLGYDGITVGLGNYKNDKESGSYVFYRAGKDMAKGVKDE